MVFCSSEDRVCAALQREEPAPGTSGPEEPPPTPRLHVSSGETLRTRCPVGYIGRMRFSTFANGQVKKEGRQLLKLCILEEIFGKPLWNAEAERKP